MNDNLFSLGGRCALVTGASSGIGRHFALTLASAGADVVLAARRLENCLQTVDDIKAMGRQAAAVTMDVTDAAGVRAAVSEAASALGPLTVLCNNAGIVVTKPFLEQNDEDWDKVLDTNLRGAYLVAQAVARHMAAHGRGGSIINTASMFSFRVGKQLSGYVTSKAALVQLTRAMAVELAVHNIRVNAIAPGYILTDFNREFFDTDAGQAVIKRIPQRRVGEVQDLDGALLLLAADAGRYITGTTISVDGGHAVNPV
jgi:NAD(P)-dependent dehydrogenase (short-subunit alcohol dehydrogenase family)